MKTLHYQSPRIEELKQFGTSPWGISYHFASDIYPGCAAPVLVNEPQHSWVFGSFGLVPSWATPPFESNTFTARVETISATLSFRNAWRQRQLCIVPMSAFFVPSYATRSPSSWRIERKDQRPFGVPGLWELATQEGREPFWSFTVLTHDAGNELIMKNFYLPEEDKRDIFVLHEDEYDKWLLAASEAEMLALLHPIDPALFSITLAKALNTV